MRLIFAEPIAASPYGFDKLWIGAVLFNFLTDPIDVYGNGRDFTDSIQTPYFLKQLILAENDIRILRQEYKQLKFFVWKNERLTVQKNLMGV